MTWALPSTGNRRTILLGTWISWTFYSDHLALHPHPGFHLLARNSSLLGLSVLPDWKTLLHHLFCHSSWLLSPMEEVSSKEKYHSFKILISPPWLSPGRVHDTVPWDCVCSWAAQSWHFMLGGWQQAGEQMKPLQTNSSASEAQTWTC